MDYSSGAKEEIKGRIKEEKRRNILILMWKNRSVDLSKK
jgi:hypothetical protein